MLIGNFPTFGYITWQGLIITSEDNTPYVINDSNTSCKYVYWEAGSPYTLKASDERLSTGASRYLIYFNDNGVPTEPPQDKITIQYRESSSGLIKKITGQFNELDGKYYAIKQDVDGLEQLIGSSGETEDGSLIDRLNKIEQTAEGTKETITSLETRYNTDEEGERLRDNITSSLIAMMTSLSEYQNVVSNVCEDLEITAEEKLAITQAQTNILTEINKVEGFHNILLEKIEDVEVEQMLHTRLEALKDSVDDLNLIVIDSISDNTIVPSEITIMLNTFGTVGVKANDYKETLSQAIVLGVGGEVISSAFSTIKTANGFTQSVSRVREEMGEVVEDTKTLIEQTADEVSMSCVKFDKTTSKLTVGDEFIKLDAATVLMTGTLTWDTLDDTAKENLKGESGSAEYVMLIGDQIIKYSKDNVPDKKSVTLTLSISNIDNPSSIIWKYRVAGSDSWITISSNQGKTSFLLNENDSIWSGKNSVTIRAIVNNTFYDDMTVVKIKDGADGRDGYDVKSVKIIGEQVFKYSSTTATKPTPETITLKAEQTNFTSTECAWYYKDVNGKWVELVLYDNQNTMTVNYNDNIFVGQYATIKYVANDPSLYDIFTIAKVVDGSDGYAVILTNENHSVPCDTDGTPENGALDDAITSVVVYQGAVDKTASATIGYDCKGCEASKTSFNTFKIAKLTSNKATLEIVVTIDGKVFNKTMTITKALRGKQGVEGAGLNILGEFDSLEELKKNVTSAKPGDAYVVKIDETTTKVFIWSAERNDWGDGIDIKGEQGIPGKDGEDGLTTYIHIKYSDDGKTFTANNGETLGKWMGQYTNFEKEDSNVFNDYNWFKVVGEDGEHGIVANLTNDSHIIPVDSNGNPGTNSFNGCTTKIELTYRGASVTSGVTYSYTKSDSIAGTWSNGTYTVTGLSADTGYVDLKATYQGVGYTKRFTVSKNVNGSDSYVVNLSNDSHAFITDANGTLIGNATTTTVITVFKGTTVVNPTNITLPTVSGLTLSKSGSTVTIKAGSGLAKSGSFDITVNVDGKTFKKTFSYVVVANGEDGADGKDGYTVVLTNETETFNADATGKIASNITKTTQVLAFKGTTAVTPTIGTLPTVTGLTLSKSGTTITIVANTGTSLATTGSFTIPITVDGVSFKKTFSWSKVLNGKDGADGKVENLPTWITEWDGNKTTINDTTVLAPKIFAGSVSNGNPTGVAMGVNVFGTSGTYSNISGIAGYKNGTKTYHLSTDGSVLFGTTSGQYISWDGSNLKMNVSSLSISSNNVATVNAVDNAINTNNTSLANIYATKSEVTSDSIVNKVTSSESWKTQTSNISSAQSAAKTANTNAGKAQSTADTAKSTADANKSNISSLATRVSSAEQKITSTAIVNTVTSSTSWSNLSGDVSGLATRMSSAEQKITSNAIVSTVTSSTNWKDLNSTASTAKSTADTAKTTANSAKSTADSAKTTANSAKSTADSASSSVTQLSNKFNWIVKSGTSQSNMTLTDKMYSLISANVTIQASKIKLEGYTTVNGNFKIDTSGNMIAKNGTFTGNITGGTITGSKIIGSGTGNRILINNGDYEVQTGSTTKGFFGLRTLDDGYESCRLALSSTGIKRATDNYLVIQPYNANANPQSYAYPYVDIAYRCQGFKGDDGYGDASNIKMYGDGVMRLSPIKKLEITTNFTAGSYGGSGERDIAIFGSSSSNYYPTYLDVRGCIRNHQSNHGLILAAKRTDNSNGFLARAVVYSDGYRAFAPVRPTSDNVPHYLGSGSYRWQTLYSVNSVNTSSDITLKENIKYLCDTPNARAIKSNELNIQDMYNFIRDDLFLTSYNWIEDPEKEEKLGFIAQDIVNTKVGEKIIICNRDRDDTLGYDSGNFEATIAGALKVNINKTEIMQKEIDTLKNEIAQLKEIINNLVDKL